MPDRHFGHIPGIPVGTVFNNRLELSLSGVHPPNQAGISGSQQEGADSIVLSGGYEDDQDFGEVIIYTGHGGRDVLTGKQVTHQILVRQNLALAKNCQLGLPVRVIRGYRQNSPYSPESGYRYDGLYYVDSYWKERGRSGYDVWKFKLIRSENSDSAFPGFIVEDEQADYGSSNPKRKPTTIQRLIRDTDVSRKIKALYNHHCQVCNLQLITNAGFYSEAAHIQPLGSPHNGPDVLSNVLCLCPNHHVMFDFGGFSIDDNFDLLGLEGRLTVHPNHRIDVTYLQYHRRHYWE